MKAGGAGDRPRPLRIAMVGQKGLPATFGGIEHHVENIGRRLAERGHQVTVFCRSSYGPVPTRPYHGMNCVHAPTVGTKHLDAIVHSATSTAKAMAAGVDVIHYHGMGPGLVAPMPRLLSSAAVVMTIHGLDHQRAKWNPAAQAVLGASHWMSGHVPHHVVVVSQDLQRHYRDRFGRETSYIANGSTQAASASADVIRAAFGLERGRYALFVGRLVPEKRPDLLIRAFRRLEGDFRLAVVGDSSFSDDFSRHLRQLAEQDPRIVFTGFAYGDTLGALYEHAGVFVQPSALEGLPLTLLEAISHDAPVLVSDLPAHREVIRGGSARHRVVGVGAEDELLQELREMLSNPAEPDEGSRAVRDSVIARYSWETAVDELEAVYYGALGARRDASWRGRSRLGLTLASAGRRAQ